MNTADQTFIRAYGSDFVPSYADEAARAADYPALADSNVNAVFGSRPQQHYRVDGPSATPNTAALPVAGGNQPAPLPARPYAPQQATPQPLPPAPAPQDPYAQHQHAQIARPAVAEATIQSAPLESAPAEAPIEPQPQRVIEQVVDVETPRDTANTDTANTDTANTDAANTHAPPASHPRVPRPHINFAAVAEPELEPVEAEAPVEPQVDLKPTPAPVETPGILTAGDGLAVLADSSVLIGSSAFEWPTVEPATVEAPTVAKAAAPVFAVQPADDSNTQELDTQEVASEVSQPAASVTEPVAEPTEVASVEEVQADVTPPAVAPDVSPAEETSGAEPPLSPAVANVDKEAAGATMEVESDEPVAVRQKLKPAWEVDRLLWPVEADHLYESESEYFRHAGEKLRDASQEGLRVLGISSHHEGEGCTTLAICLARAAAGAGAKVCLLDANLRSPQLGTVLGLDFARSWHETLNTTTPLAEAAVTAIADNVTLIPLSKNAARQGTTLDGDGVNEILAQLSETFDLVLVDIGSPQAGGQNCFPAGDACPLDAAIVVRDVRATSEEETLESVSWFRELGIDAVGVAENFASSAAAQAAA